MINPKKTVELIEPAPSQSNGSEFRVSTASYPKKAVTV